jgi:hypothetical protein
MSLSEAAYRMKGFITTTPLMTALSQPNDMAPKHEEQARAKTRQE